MADTKISGLSAVTNVLSTDEFVLARAGTTKKITGADLESEIGGTGGAGLFDAYVHLRDEKTANTVGGTATATTWTARTLNVEKTDDSAICSLSANQFTLSAGVYRIQAHAPFYVTGRIKLRLRNTTGSTTLVVGASAKAIGGGSGDTPHGHATLVGQFTVAASQALELQYYAEAVGAGGTRGLGVETNSGEIEVYAEVELWRYA